MGNHLEFKKKRRIKPFVLSRRCKIVFRARCISTCRLTMFYLSEGIDNGDIIAQEIIKIE